MKKTGIVDCTLFYEPYHTEMIDFRINLLKDHVDWFIITEANRTHTGNPTPYRFEEIAEERGFPMEKIIYLKCDLSDDTDLRIDHDDIVNVAYVMPKDSKSRLQSQYNRARERIHRDYFLNILEYFDEDTVFIISDADEIIKPSTIPYITNVCRNNKNIIVKIPLMNLQGRADLQVFNKYTGEVKGWNSSMFIAQPYHLRKNSANKIRSEIQIDFPILYITQDGEVIQNLGWHFSWLGKSNHRIEKVQSYPHSHESFGNAAFESQSDPAYRKFLKDTRFRDGSTPPSGCEDAVLRKISLDLLPDLLFSKREYIDFFFGLE